MVDRSLDSARDQASEERGFDADGRARSARLPPRRAGFGCCSRSALFSNLSALFCCCALWPSAGDAEPRGSLWGGIVLILLARLMVGICAAARSAISRLRQRSLAAADKAVSPTSNLAIAAPLLLFVYALTLYGFVAPEPVSWLVQFPGTQGIGARHRKRDRCGRQMDHHELERVLRRHHRGLAQLAQFRRDRLRRHAMAGDRSRGPHTRLSPGRAAHDDLHRRLACLYRLARACGLRA